MMVMDALRVRLRATAAIAAASCTAALAAASSRTPPTSVTRQLEN